MIDNWKKFDTGIHTQKGVLLIVAILIFFPVFYFFLYPNIGTVESIVTYFVFLIIAAFLIRIWGKRKFEEKS